MANNLLAKIVKLLKPQFRLTALTDFKKHFMEDRKHFWKKKFVYHNLRGDFCKKALKKN